LVNIAKLANLYRVTLQLMVEESENA
jgi:hypothetical protein